MIYEQIEPSVLHVAITPDGKTMAVSNRNGEVHLLSTLSTLSTNQPSSLKCFCRSTINTYCGVKRKDLLNLPIMRPLINYVLYKDI